MGARVPVSPSGPCSSMTGTPSSRPYFEGQAFVCGRRGRGRRAEGVCMDMYPFPSWKYIHMKHTLEKATQGSKLICLN